MLPVSTPPNAIVYGSGLVPIPRMMRAGVLFDVVGLFVIWLGLAHPVSAARAGVTRESLLRSRVAVRSVHRLRLRRAALPQEDGQHDHREIARNSLCQFWSDSNQNCDAVRYCHDG